MELYALVSRQLPDELVGYLVCQFNVNYFDVGSLVIVVPTKLWAKVYSLGFYSTFASSKVLDSALLTYSAIDYVFIAQISLACEPTDCSMWSYWL